MSDRVNELFVKEKRLQERCALQRALIASEVANIEARFERVDRIAGVVRSALLHPAVIVGGIAALLTVGRLRGTRLIGRAYLLSRAVGRLLQTVRVFHGLLERPRTDARARRR